MPYLLTILMAALALLAPARLGYAQAESELRDLVDRFSLDRQALGRRYSIEASPERVARFKEFYQQWSTRLAEVSFDRLGVEGRIDHILLRNRIAYDRSLLERQERRFTETAPLLPFAGAITDLHEARLRMESLDAAAAARGLDALAALVDKTRRAVEAGAGGPPDANGATALRPTKVIAYRAQTIVGDLKMTLDAWYRFYSGYDPLFTWWTAEPFKRATGALDAYAKMLREKGVGIRPGEEEPIVGDPVGRQALTADLGFELIPYTPEDLLAVAEREFSWCEAEMKKAARDMGFGDDWRAALEKVKTLHVDPGKQPDLIRDLAREAEAYVEQHDLITVPPLAKEVWRMQMMSPERQRVNPFFTGGETISVSFPVETMSYEDKLMSMRGNNIHFARATVFHELIPGHHLQGFMTARYNSHRSVFRTPFWGEGWALYWEMLLWDLGFQKSPENRVGMLFWRSHRAARIMFSLRFHLGEWTPEQCIDFLVDRVGHERANAAAEVRRSFAGSDPPLYQLAYMMGGLQFRALHRELVGAGGMTNRQFHDAIITGGSMPVEMVRARLLKPTLPRDYRPSWKYAGDKPSGR